MCEREQLEQLRVVVEHFFKMRDEPLLIDRIARETAAEVIVDAALANALKRMFDDGKEERVVAPSARAPEKFVHRGIGKLRCAAQAAMHRIECAGNLLRKAVKFGRADHRTTFGPRGLRKPLHTPPAILRNLVGLLTK